MGLAEIFTCAEKKLDVCGNRILVKRASKKEEKIGSLYIPDAYQEKPEYGTVIKIGDVDNVDVGDNIVFRRFAGATFGLDDEDFVVLHKRDVVGKFIDGKFNVLNGLILIKYKETDSKMKHGSLELVRPDDYQYNLHEAEEASVIQVSKDIKWENSVEIKKNDKIVLIYNSGAPVKVDGEECYLIKPVDILLKLKEG